MTPCTRAIARSVSSTAGRCGPAPVGSNAAAGGGPRGVQLLPAALADVVLEPAIDPGDPLVGLAGALVVVRLRLQPLTVMGLQCIVRLDSPMN